MNYNDLPALFSYLKTGKPITVLIAPAARTVLPDFPRILGVFRALGAGVFFPVLPYADITAWVYYRFLKEKKETLVSSACVGIHFAGIEKRVYSPLLCAARYLRTYRGIGGAFAFFSPCNQKRFEFKVQRNNREEELVHYNITIAALSEWLSGAGIDPGAYPPCETGGDEDALDFSQGLTVERFGTISGALTAVIPDLEYAVAEGAQSVTRYANAENRPRFFEPYACIGGCANGSGVPAFLRKNSGGKKNADSNPAVKTALLERFQRFDTVLDVQDFCYDR